MTDDPILFNFSAQVVIYLVAIGLLSGLLGGLLGIGGGVVIVPALILLIDTTNLFEKEYATLIAVATSLTCIIFTSASAAFTQARSGMVRWDLFRKLILFFVLGSFTAGLLTPYLPAPLMRGLIAGFLLFVSVVMWSNWKPNAQRQLPGGIVGAIIGYLGGSVAGVAGIAGGNVIVPTLIYFNTPAHNATATSSALGVPIAAAGALSYGLLNTSPIAVSHTTLVGYVDLAFFSIITLAAIIAAPVGVRMAHKLPAAKLKRMFAVLLLFVGGRMLYTAFAL